MSYGNHHRGPIILAAAIALAALTTLGAQEEQEEQKADYDDLLQQFTAAEKKGDYAKALGIAQRVEEITLPRQIEILYNLARMHALTGDRSGAYESLYRATDSGFWDAKRMMEDEAFEAIRDEELFKTLTRKAWSNGYLWMLERDQREEYQKKDQVLEVLAPKPWEERPWGPPESQHLSEETLTTDLAQAGLRTLGKHDFISEQFFIVYETE